ncbi:MAG: hypothetical protein IT378_12385, partial [Sandaracinaceae bacterium]|nr:hypothetical protein [Sandaracinaceae bacterium]
MYDESVVIVGGFHCPSELPRLLGDPAVICSDQPVEQPIPGEVCARAPRSCQMPALDGGPPGAPVGGACVPEAVPENGFLSSEVYLETSHAACSSEQCLVYRLMGDPRPGCTGPT